MIPVKRVMARNLVTVDKHITVQEVAKLMGSKEVSSVLVLDKESGEIAGIVTERISLKRS